MSDGRDNIRAIVAESGKLLRGPLLGRIAGGRVGAVPEPEHPRLAGALLDRDLHEEAGGPSRTRGEALLSSWSRWTSAIDTLALARSAKDPTQEKYDNLVPVELAAEDFAARKLDGPGAEAAIRDMIGR